MTSQTKSNWRDYLKLYRNNRNFNAKQWSKNKVTKFNNYLKDNNLSGAVLALSGGVDSAVTLALLKKTMELECSNLKKILVLSQPIHSSKWAYNRAKELCDKYGLKLTVIDQTDIYNNLIKKIKKNTGIKTNKFSGGQLRSYMRTPVNYYCAQLLTSQNYPALVVGTGNMDEDGYLAYFCKAGDGVVDVQLISDLHKSEVFLVGKYLDVTDRILNAKPSADLWENQEDEIELGFPYDFIEFFTGVYLKMNEIEKKQFFLNLDESSREEFLDFSEKCLKIHNRNKHKLNGIINI